MLQIPKSDVLFENPDEDTSPTRSLPPLTPKFDPLSRALRITRPDISLSDFDLVTTAGCLRRIASFLSYYPQPERLDVEFRGGTLFMGRWEGDPLLNKHHGYGRQFEKKVTRLGEGLERSVSCHLVAGYELGGMKMGVQIEVDAYQCKCHWPPGLQPPKGAPGEKRQDPSGAPGGKRRASSGRFDILSLDTLSLDAEPPQNEAPDGILRLGTPLPLSCAVEIKTRQANSFIDCLYLQQLYFQRTHRVFLGIHDSERFQKKDMDFPDKWRGMKAWEKRNPVLLGLLVALLRRVRGEAVKRVGEEGVCKMALVLSIGEGVRERGSWKAVLDERDGEALVSEI